MTKNERKSRARVRRYAQNILTCYLSADDATRAAGACWYALEAQRCRDYARATSLSARPLTSDAVAGAAAAISPGLRWEHTFAYLDALRRNPRSPIPTYSREFVRRALACLRGRPPLTVISGPKVTAFYLLLSGRDMDAVVIDGHALNIARAKRETFRAREDYRPPAAAIVTAARYRDCATAYREVAEVLGLPPHAVQATTWIHWRNLAHEERGAP